MPTSTATVWRVPNTRLMARNVLIRRVAGRTGWDGWAAAAAVDHAIEHGPGSPYAPEVHAAAQQLRDDLLWPVTAAGRPARAAFESMIPALTRIGGDVAKMRAALARYRPPRINC